MDGSAIDYSKLTLAFHHLKAQWENYATCNSRPELSPLDRDAIRESVIQRFEVTYDVLWKAIKRYMMFTLGLPDIPNSPKPILRLAYENGMLSKDIAFWLTIADARVATSHDYSSIKADTCIELIPAFLDAIQPVIRQLECPE
jgi:nucleotidyltransferase substrate binding protein (TIGR01987 family)